ncbi:glycosyltransferase family 2 protein [Actibacterium mucosum]|nr:cellulose synthase catalytic subunit [Actibacterium mucosum]
MSARREAVWHLLAGITVGLGAYYLWWRWTQSLNPDALLFSTAVALAETAAYLGSLLFFYDIWREDDTPWQSPPTTRREACLEGDGSITVDLFITTYDEEVDVVEPSVLDALKLVVPKQTRLTIHVLDDGDRPIIAQMAKRHGVNYISRQENTGFKAGNLRNALFRTSGDFLVICDADTRVLPGMLMNTLGYFRAPDVAWVQTPHWFYDIPEGQDWARWLAARKIPFPNVLASLFRFASGKARVGADPYLSNSGLFFDVIQRRRNRHGASFCCGAGSIHRREAIFENALQQKSNAVRRLSQKTGAEPRSVAGTQSLQPYRFHVSEDIYTSILLHSDSTRHWRSVYHPGPQARMLSPWSIDAWTTQKLKYAGGTFDIMLRANPLFRRGMKWQTKLHYLATFWSYLGVLWMPVLLLAPVVAMFTGIAPVEAYSLAFFLHLVPLLVANELAVSVGCKQHDPGPGRLLAIATLPIQLRAFVMVLRGKRPRFPPTPKTPGSRAEYRRVYPNIAVLALFIAAAIVGVLNYLRGAEGFTEPVLIVNLFWLGWNALAMVRAILAAGWTDPEPQSQSHAGVEADAVVHA